MKRLKINTTRARQIALVGLLAICAAQVTWWVLDQIRETARVRDQMIALHQGDIRAAHRLFHAGVPMDEILGLYPHLTSQGPGHFEIKPKVVEGFNDKRFRRLNRYGWEGAFFLVVLFSGMWVLAKALKQEAELRHRQENFVASVSHEFKSPLASIKLTTETLTLRDPPPERRKYLLQRTLEDTERLEMMVANILDASRIGAGRLHFVRERLLLAEVVWVVLEEVRERAKLQQIKIAKDVSEELELYADATAVRTVIRNLVDNAIKATVAADGGKIYLRAEARGGKICLEVRDSGVGFAPEEAKKLFEKFYRPGDKGGRKTPGSGLGLYIVRSFVEIDRGEVTAYSKGVNQGATFHVCWPEAKKKTS